MYTWLYIYILYTHKCVFFLDKIYLCFVEKINRKNAEFLSGWYKFPIPIVYADIFVFTKTVNIFIMTGNAKNPSI